MPIPEEAKKLSFLKYKLRRSIIARETLIIPIIKK
jgi:hypothetical protein